MENEIVYLPTKLHALLMRMCDEQHKTPSQIFESAMRHHIERELPMARLIIRTAAKLKKGGVK